ncbi:MAG: tRNA pseudouridine(38-40) synthase TruA [Bacillota bacterium]|jgi:tRNA pseudouridine38-40 synthase|nr:tRNA pseudouridine(38-40) synthase TruA [Bacillota bacterium]HHU43937.1 tRNA pseudouridine(38-40) synthase TruA [Clostridiales bacterium]
MRYLITIEYNGKNYCGWQYQKNALSVQQVIEDKIFEFLGQRVKLAASGRTDSGVHAFGQRAHFDIDTYFPMKRFPLAINNILPDDIKIKDIQIVDGGFHAQYDAKRKIYVYKLYISRIESPIRKDTHARIIPPFDFELMKEGAKLFLNTHDFKAFSSTGGNIKNTVRTIYRLELEKIEDEITMEIEGDGFLYNMVRIIAGTLVWLGKKKLSLEDIKEAMLTQNRKKAGKTFPAHALYLKEVIY